jgi:hypothetical protein
LKGRKSPQSEPARADQDQNDRGDQDDRIVETRTKLLALPASILEAVPDYLPKAAVDVGLRAVDHTHRRSLAAFQALRGLAEPIDFSGLRSDN